LQREKNVEGTLTHSRRTQLRNDIELEEDDFLMFLGICERLKPGLNMTLFGDIALVSKKVLDVLKNF